MAKHAKIEVEVSQEVPEAFVKPLTSIYLAWYDAGPNPEYHEGMQNVVRDCMPTLGRALDNLVISDVL